MMDKMQTVLKFMVNVSINVHHLYIQTTNKNKQ